MTPEKAATDLINLYGRIEAIKIVQKDLEKLIAQCDFLNDVFSNLINAGTGETER